MSNPADPVTDDLDFEGSAPSGARQPPSSETDALVEWIYSELRRAEPSCAAQREESEECRKFYDGHQWDTETEAELKKDERPKVTHNLIKSTVNSVVGHEIQNRQRFIFAPRDQAQEQQRGTADLATEGVAWAIANRNCEAERSRAFRDFLNGGMGWIQSRMDYDRDEEGEYVEERVSIDEMVWDPDARMPCLEDMRWVARNRDWPLTEVEERFPGKWEEVSYYIQTKGLAPGTAGVESPLRIHESSPSLYDEGAQRVMPGSSMNVNRGTSVRVVQFQYTEREPIWRVPVPVMEPVPPPPLDPMVQQGPGMPLPAPPTGPDGKPAQQQKVNPQTGEPEFKLVTLDKEKYAEWRKYLTESGQEIPDVIKQYRWRYLQTFLLGPVLLQEPEVLQIRDFSYSAICEFYDEEDGVWYGLVRALLDAQRGVNKFHSLGIELFARSPKQTFFVERGAVADPKRMVENATKIGGMVLLNDGALQQGKVKVEAPPQPPAATDSLMAQSIQAFTMINGFDLNALSSTPGTAGTKERDALNQGRGFGVLATFFQTFGRYRRHAAHLVLAFLREFMSDGRWIRVGGPYGGQFIQILRDPLTQKFDLILDDVPSDPNQKKWVWETLSQLMPMLVRAGVFPTSLLEYAPLPAVVLSRMKAEIEKNAAAAAQQPKEEPRKKDEDPEYIKSETELNKSQAALNYARAKAIAEEAELGNYKTVQEIDAAEDERMVREQGGSKGNGSAPLGRMRASVDPHSPGIRTGNGQ